MLPDGFLSRQVCSIGSIEQLRLCLTLILIQEKPTVVHRGSLSTNYASHYVSQNSNINRTLFRYFFLSYKFSHFHSLGLELKRFFDYNMWGGGTHHMQYFNNNNINTIPGSNYLLWQLQSFGWKTVIFFSYL